MKRIIVVSTWLVVLPLAVGCRRSAEPENFAEQQATPSGHGHTHSHGAGPHGGTLTDWGGGAYHVEFTVDHDAQKATVYIIGGDEISPQPIKTNSIQLMIDEPQTELELTADPLEGEVDGQSSRFVGTHATLGIVREFSGTISGLIADTPYSGTFKEEPH